MTIRGSQRMPERDRRQAGRRLRAAGPKYQRHHPQFAGDQRLRAADRPALRHARPDRARQRQLRTCLGAVARDGARHRPPRRDPRGPGAPGRDGHPRRHRPAARSASSARWRWPNRKSRSPSFSRAQEFEADGIGVGIASRAGFDPYGARALPHVDGTQRRTEGAARHIDPRAPDFLSSHPATPERVSNAQANARQFAGPAPARATAPNISRVSTA